MNKPAKILVSAIMVLSICYVSVPLAEAGSLSNGSKAALLMDVETGEVLYDHNGQVKLPPASTTKIMTGILGIELAHKNELVKVSEKAGAVNESTMYLDPGNEFYLEELLYGAMLKSGNDACVAIGEQVAGTEMDFVHMMNTKAQLLGATNTSFKNTNGLPNKEHLVTAQDLARIACYALQNPHFAQIVQTKNKNVGTWQRGGQRILSNTNQLLWSYPHATGVKTGTTRAAGQCLVASAEKNEHSLVAVVLNSPDRFGTAQQLLEYGFNNYINKRIAEAGAYYQNIAVQNSVRTSVPLVFEDDLVVSISKKDVNRVSVQIQVPTKITAPISRGQRLGAYQVILDGQIIGQTNLLAGENCTPKPVTRRWLDYLSEYVQRNR